ncbi:MAG: site-specific integrase [Chlorobi bacterium]|nr:site-specific integrase [Chlorobiota bacterium]MCI0715807.1 site-specific integrase [Chlorobiota bacterium]
MNQQLTLAYNNPYSYKHIEPFIGKGYKGNYYIYYTNLETGKRTKKTTNTKNQREANRELEIFKRRYYNNIGDLKIRRISELSAYYRQYKNQDFRPRTLEIYFTAFKKLISVIGDKELRKIIFLDMDRFKSILSGKMKDNSVNIYLRTLKSAFNFAKKAGLIDYNPMDGIKMIKIDEKERLCFEKEDVPKLIKCLELPFLERIVKFNLETGLRRGELLNVQWNDIDFVRQELKIRNKDNFKIKTNQERVIPLTNKMLVLLNQNPYENDSNAVIQQQLFGNVYELDFRKNINYVFGKVDGTRYTANYISRIFKKKIKTAGFDEKYHFHCLRHTALTNMANEGIPSFLIKEIAGHKKITTTESYVHPALSDIRNSLNNSNYSGLKY